jgi:hypothetical protein
MKSCDYKLGLHSAIDVFFRIHVDSGRAVMPRIERTLGEMVRRPRDKLFITFWHIGLLALGTQGVEKTVEFAPAHESNIANFHRPIRRLWTWIHAQET